ncbi:MAG: S-ribosylhomocysteine lyase [Christensenellaceae bacterium]|jgi:S-ribosylhomocysteine lyase|nr:S-ribosylhomocysteine lyase [Christensenellaceae bacterium]
MDRISSFEVNHLTLKQGMYISRIDDEIITYDIRLIKPNTPPFLEMAPIHTMEHLFATYARNLYPKNIVYFGPMGCRTGFYLLTKNLNHQDAINLVIKSMKFISNFEGVIPGVSEIECGNYLEHNLDMARVYAKAMCDVLENWTVEKLDYKYTN